MKSCLAILTASTLALASALTWTNALAGEKPVGDSFTKMVADTCGNIAAKTKDINVYNYCVAEMLRASEKPVGSQENPQEAWNGFMKLVTDTCGNIATKAKDINVLHYCVAGMFRRPFANGSSCKTFVTGNPNPGFHCDTKGMLYYEPLPPMTKEEFGNAFGKLVKKHASKSIANCFLTNENKDDVAACLERQMKTFEEVVRVCAHTDFTVGNDNDLLLHAVNHCIEDKMKL